MKHTNHIKYIAACLLSAAISTYFIHMIMGILGLDNDFISFIKFIFHVFLAATNILLIIYIADKMEEFL